METFLKYFEISTIIYDLKIEKFIFDDFRISKRLGYGNNFFYEIVDNYSDLSSKNKFWSNKKKNNPENINYHIKVEKNNKKKVFLFIEEIYFENQRLIISNIYNFYGFLKIKSLISLSNKIISVKSITPCLYNSKNETIKLLKRNFDFCNTSENNEISFDKFLKFFDAEYHIIVENILKNEDKRYRNNILKSVDKNKNVHFFQIETFRIIKNEFFYFILIDVTNFVSKEKILTENIKDLNKKNSENKKAIFKLNEKLQRIYEGLQNLNFFLSSNLKDLNTKISDKNIEHSINSYIAEMENKIEKLQMEIVPDFSKDLKLPKDFTKDKRILFDTQGKIVILIAEDEEINYAYLELLVKKIISNVEILHAKNGIEAVQIAQQNPIDLILMDLKMPLLDGLSAATKIKQFKKHIPIIIVSAFEESENEDYSSIDEYVNKPIDRSKIEKVINKYIKK